MYEYMPNNFDSDKELEALKEELKKAQIEAQKRAIRDQIRALKGGLWI